MAITPTGAIYKTLTFDGESSADYGVYITAQAVFNAPEREVEMITIPGRNGSYALDKGRFENITVTYPAGIFADTDEDFSEAISDFRNWLCSRQGYVRLEDDYNPNEYRLAIYKSGLEVELAQLKAGEFNIVFECKPQRFLTSGESEITVTSGDTISNPTYFEAGPLLEIEGYGTIEFNGYEIELTNDVFGYVVLASNKPFSKYDKYIDLNSAFYSSGDTITLTKVVTVVIVLEVDSDYSGAYDLNGIDSVSLEGNMLYLSISQIIGGTFTAGTTSTITKTLKFTYEAIESGITKRATANVPVLFKYNASSERIEINVDKLGPYFTPYSGYSVPTYTPITNTYNGRVDVVSVESTASLLGHPTYVDCDFGEAYKIENNEYISLNRYIDLGSNLPMFAVGANEITFDNTITALKVVPRWWKI